MFDDEFPKPKMCVDYGSALIMVKPDNTAYLASISRIRDAFRHAETALGGPVVMTMVDDAQNPFIYHLKFTRKP